MKIRLWLTDYRLNVVVLSLFFCVNNDAISSNHAGFLVEKNTDNKAQISGSVDFSVALTKKPTNDVVVPINTTNESAVAVGQSRLSFTTTNWMIPQWVGVWIEDHKLTTTEIDHTIELLPAQSEDHNYSGLDPVDIAINLYIPEKVFYAELEGDFLFLHSADAGNLRGIGFRFTRGVPDHWSEIAFARVPDDVAPTKSSLGKALTDVFITDLLGEGGVDILVPALQNLEDPLVVDLFGYPTENPLSVDLMSYSSGRTMAPRGWSASSINIDSLQIREQWYLVLKFAGFDRSPSYIGLRTEATRH